MSMHSLASIHRPWWLAFPRLNAASPGLIVPNRLTGREPVRIINAATISSLDFELPGLLEPYLHVQSSTGLQTRKLCELDTVIINTDDMLLTLSYRASLPLATGVHDVDKIGLAMQGYDDGEHLRSLK